MSNEIVYEKMDDFLNKLRSTLLKIEEPTVYLKKMTYRKNPESSMLSGMIIFQFCNNGYTHTYRYGELPEFMMVPESFFMAIHSEMLRKQVRDEYEMGYKEFNEKIRVEFEKAMLILNNIGVKNIVSAVVE